MRLNWNLKVDRFSLFSVVVAKYFYVILINVKILAKREAIDEEIARTEANPKKRIRR